MPEKFISKKFPVKPTDAMNHILETEQDMDKFVAGSFENHDPTVHDEFEPRDNVKCVIDGNDCVECDQWMSDNCVNMQM